MEKDNRFFDFENYIQKESNTHIIYANRNIGKSSYFIWKGGANIKSILERYNDFHPDNIEWERAPSGKLIPVSIKEGKNGRFVYLRTANNQTDLAVAMFKDLLPNCKINAKTRIIEKPFYDENDKKCENPTWIECGIIMDLSTSCKVAKSYAFDGYDFLFWDECNEIQVRVKDVWFKFIAILKTAQRMISTFKVIIIGNKDTTNDEILNVFGARPPLNPDDNEICSYPEYDATVYLIGGKDFSGLKQETLLANKLAQLDDKTDGYLNEGHFGFDYSEKIINYRKYVQPTFTPIFKFIYGIDVFYFGRFNNPILDNKQCFYIVRESRKVRWDNLAYISFDTLGGSFEAKSILLDKNTLNGFGKMFFYAFKQEVLFLNDFDTFEELIPLFTRIDLQK